MKQETMDFESVRQTVREGYGKIAQTGGSYCGSSVSCCGSDEAASTALARRVGYTLEDLSALPEGASMGLACGNPNALALLREGEVVLAVGSGGGFDGFRA